jgi:hypothetical protein
MQFLLFIKNKGKIILLLCLFLLVILISGLIIYLNNNQNHVSSNNIAVTAGPKGYAKLKKDVNNLFSDQAIAQNPDYMKFINKLAVVEDNSLSAEDKYQELIMGYLYVQYAYYDTNDHTLYSLPQEVNNFIQTNFPKQYQKDDFAQTNCEDKICADEPQAPEILKVADEINASSAPDVVKETFAQELINVGYLSKTDPHYKMVSYIMVAGVLNNSGALTQAGLNAKLSQEILDYVQKTYPDEYKDYKNEK